MSKIIHYQVGKYYVVNEGTERKPLFQVYVKGITESFKDTPYDDIDSAVTRCNYLYRTFNQKRRRL